MARKQALTIEECREEIKRVSTEMNMCYRDAYRDVRGRRIDWELKERGDKLQLELKKMRIKLRSLVRAKHKSQVMELL